jgi:uncharacterized protein YndB with AHSA1/START domain
MKMVLLKLQLKTIKQTVVIPKATPQQVYDAYTDPKKHAEFTGSDASGEPVVGGKFTAWDGYIFGKFIELEAGKRVVQEWQTTDWVDGYGASKLELTFKAVSGGTELSMVHSDVPKEKADELSEGWIDFYWDPLKDYFSQK